MTQEQNIAALFVHTATAQPQRTAYIHDDKTISFGELHTQVLKTVAAYTRKGIGKDDKVLVLVPMSIELYRIVLALFYLGACPVFLDEWVSVARLKKCCEVVPCKAIVAGSKFIFLSYFIGVLRRMPIKIKSRAMGQIPGNQELTDVHANDTALVTFTTGTTGIPKAADRTHGFLRAQYDALLPLIDNGAKTSLVLLPIVVLINLGLGKTTVLPSKRFAAKRPETINWLARDIANHNAEEMIGSPAVVQSAAKYLCQHGLNVSIMKHVLTGGGAVFPDMAKDICAAFKNATCAVVYGSTEAEPISHTDMKLLATVTAEYIYEKGLPVGFPDGSVSIAIIPIDPSPIPAQTGEQFGRMCLPCDAIGEIAVTGEHVLKAYINNNEAVAKNKINVDGTIWHRTGDAGSKATNGGLHLWGPYKEIINYDGRTYYPLITCYTLQQMTGVKRAALLMLNGKLTLVMEQNLAINMAVLEQLHLTEARIISTDKIPMDARHQTKTDYEALRKMLGNV